MGAEVVVVDLGHDPGQVDDPLDAVGVDRRRDVLRGRTVRIEADRAVPWGADGEVDAVLPVTARVLPGALRMLY